MTGQQDGVQDGVEEVSHAYRQHLAELQADCPTPPATREEIDAEREAALNRAHDLGIEPW
ncbi:hypothetical protein [Streptomyces sp. NBC_00470]|uniref:hypothetical protein n=1 Tax=Streptomyces sp. NBC_00470 TaxID=2975753 RepID=UPI002F9070DA